MKALRLNGVRIAFATTSAVAASFLTVGRASADPSDPVCILPPYEFCNIYGSTIFGTGPNWYNQCLEWAEAQYYGEYCNPTYVGLTAIKPD